MATTADRAGREMQSSKQQGRQLRQVRKKQGLSRADVARSAGLTRRELAAYERGRVDVPESDLWCLAGSCGVDVGELLPERGPLSPTSGLSALPVADSIRHLRGPGEPDGFLREYLAMVYELRNLPPGSRVPLREPDLAQLADALGGSPEIIEQRLVDLIGASRDEAARLRAMILPPLSLPSGNTSSVSDLYAGLGEQKDMNGAGSDFFAGPAQEDPFGAVTMDPQMAASMGAPPPPDPNASVPFDLAPPPPDFGAPPANGSPPADLAPPPPDPLARIDLAPPAPDLPPPISDPFASPAPPADAPGFAPINDPFAPDLAPANGNGNGNGHSDSESILIDDPLGLPQLSETDTVAAPVDSYMSDTPMLAESVTFDLAPPEILVEPDEAPVDEPVDVTWEPVADADSDSPVIDVPDFEVVDAPLVDVQFDTQLVDTQPVQSDDLEEDVAPIAWSADGAPAPVGSASDPMASRFEQAGANWRIGGISPGTAMADDGALALRRADARWALADIDAPGDFTVEATIDFTAGAGFGVLFRATVDESERVSGYSFDLDPVAGGGGYLLRQWEDNRQHWRPLEQTLVTDPGRLYGRHTLQLTLRGDHLTVVVDDEVVLSVPALSRSSVGLGRGPCKGGGIGIQAWATTEVTIDAFRVAQA